MKRVAVSRPQERKDAGPSLANIGLCVHSLVKIRVHLYSSSSTMISLSVAVLVCRHRQKWQLVAS